MNQLSILIPTYNHVCLGLVKDLQAQASLLPDFEYEILVADDGSTDKATIENNRYINELPHCRYIERDKNVGRAVIRNFLAKEATYEWLLFVDSDLYVDNPQFIHNYIQTPKGDVIVGGLKIGGNSKELANNLRYRYEKSCEKSHDYQHRLGKGDKEFRTTNFIISRKVMQECPFDENFKFYGYEDVLLGKSIKEKGYTITHIDNPILLADYETNYQFINKTEEACRTLYQFRKELQGYSKLIEYADKLNRLYFVCPLIKFIYPWISLHIKARLIGNKINIFWFNIYKLMYYIHLYN